MAGVIITYSWDFGDGSAISHQQNPTHTYALSGTFNVKLTIVNSNGCHEGYDHTCSCQSFTCCGIQLQLIQAVLVLQFNIPICRPLPPGYIGSIVKWVWDFGDGTSVTIFAPANPDVSHTFNGTGAVPCGQADCDHFRWLHQLYRTYCQQHSFTGC